MQATTPAQPAARNNSPDADEVSPLLLREGGPVSQQREVTLV